MEINDTTPTTGKREARKQDRRQAIIEAARQSFLEAGYAATSMSGLLKTLGGSKATLWGYFRSKEELFAAVVEDLTVTFLQELERDLALTGALEPTLTRFCRRFMESLSGPEALATWRLVVAESGRFPEVGRIFFEQAPRRLQSALRHYLAHKINLGELRDEDPGKMAEMLASLCASQHTRMLWGGSDIDLADIHQRSQEYTAYFLRAFRAE
ncbi:TetR/AcrR family transcriptional regulator [Sphingobium sp. BYY-5]|uniref:TetR/AcrR family transcriptional regulator n=1 Tax=Sphingobium sp. BYY-5 TaxID=2926400 RepID=UPI001FA7DBE5|nr:TetR/AcrR family transcriptional regulator [Sphingobium sp. BYY-5]MCI4589521.1 TetR/AcrR family transcriptional regulator [Sphingobium sp. BYY-5]